MAALEAALGRALAGDAPVVGVVAEAGVGKSRLCFEFFERCRARGIATYQASGVAHGKGIPLLPILQLLRNYFGIGDADSAAVAREKIAGRLLLLDRALDEQLPVVWDFLGVGDPERPAPLAAPNERQQQLADLVRRVVQARGQREATVTLLEDLHWFDGASDAFVTPLVEGREGTRALLVANFRPEYHADWMQRSYYQQLALRPLGAEATEELLQALLGTDPSLGGLAVSIRERTGGNPFFVEEVVQSLAETGDLAGERGAYRLVQPIGAIRVPATVQAVLAARIDRLPEREKAVLQTAAVIGKEFSEPILRRVLRTVPSPAPAEEGPGGGDLAAALRVLVEVEFLHATALYPEAEYSFKHPLTQEVAYQSQLSERRRRVHAAVAAALERIDAAKLDERAALLAHHREAAGEALAAAGWHARAARWTQRSDYGETRRHWRRVRALLAGVTGSPEAERLAVTACEQLLYLGSRLGMPDDEAAALFEDAKTHAMALGDRRLRASALYGHARFRLIVLGDWQTAISQLREAIALAEEANDRGFVLAGRAVLTTALTMAGRLLDALDVNDANIRQAPADLSLGADVAGYSPYLLSLAQGASLLASTGRPREGQDYVERALQHVRQQEWTPVELRGWIHVFACLVALDLGDSAAALNHAREAAALVERVAIPALEVSAFANLGAAYVLREEWSEAVAALEHGLAVLHTHRTQSVFEVGCLARLAEAHLGRGEIERASALARQAVEIAPTRPAPSFECGSQLTLARVLLRAEGLAARAEIEAALARATALVEETGARVYEPLIHVERAALAHLQGELVTRQHELREAHRLFTAMGATGHAERISRQLSAVSPQPEEQ
jgi:adenylate cyclase